MSPHELHVDHLQRQLREVQRLDHLGFYEWDLQTGVMRWSHELCLLFGVSPDQAPKTLQAYLDLVHPDDRDEASVTMQEAARWGRAYAFDHRILRPDGTVRWVRCRGTSVRGESGRPTWLYGVKRDITDAMVTELALRRFVADAAHELRTPTASILHATELLRPGRPTSTDEQERVLDALHRQAHRLDRVARRLLDLSTLEQGIQTVLLRPVAVAPVVERAVSDLAPRRVQVDLAQELTARATPELLERALVNLLRHAFRDGSRHVRVSGRRRGFEAVLAVEDDGPSLLEEDVPALFIPLRCTFDGSRDARCLAVAHRAAASFGGSLHYEPVQPQGGRLVLRLEVPRPGEEEADECHES